MEIYAPDYYKSFSCIADECKHTCCAGWEIDIDDETLKKYKACKNSFAEQIMENIEETDGISHFILKEERCPFLNNDNLCDIILNLDESYLCGICSDHPRFRNFFDSRTEIGLGLCCEEAARIILNNKDKVTTIKIETDSNEENFSEDEQIFFDFRENITEIIQNREKPVKERIFDITSRFSVEFPYKTPKEWRDVFLSLEQLNSEWGEMLLGLADGEEGVLLNSDFEIEAEQLLVYFIFRHLADGLYDGRLRERIGFSVLSVKMIDYLVSSHLKKYGTVGIEDIIEISRLYSSEIEYCEENIETLLSVLEK